MKLKPATPKQVKPTGYIIYEGPSLLDGAPIVVIALTGKSANSKTGALMQTYILRSDLSPLDAIKAGKDVSICGDCIHRGSAGRKRSCYVNIGQGAMMVFKTYMAGKYPKIRNVNALVALGWKRKVRLGTYGDPAAVPAKIWNSLTLLADSNTGYTHQLNHPNLTQKQISAITDLCMVSADTPADVEQAKARGLRYFRIRLANESVGAKEFVCPASEEAGKRLQCADCMACSGTSKGKASPVIIAHGSYKSNYRTFRLTAA